jgi:hypothetical protein
VKPPGLDDPHQLGRWPEVLEDGHREPKEAYVLYVHPKTKSVEGWPLALTLVNPENGYASEYFREGYIPDAVAHSAGFFAATFAAIGVGLGFVLGLTW